MTRSAALASATLLCVLALPAMAAGEGGEKPASQTTEAKPADKDAQDRPLSPFVQAAGGKTRRAATKSKVYGNDDLERMYGRPEPPASEPAAAAEASAGDVPGSDPAPPAEAAAAEPSALDQLEAGEASRKERAQQIAEAERRVADARQQLAEVEKRNLAVRNPLLARPATPEEGAEAWNAADGQGRVTQTEEQLAAAREALAKAEQELVALGGTAP